MIEYIKLSIQKFAIFMCEDALDEQYRALRDKNKVKRFLNSVKFYIFKQLLP